VQQLSESHDECQQLSTQRDDVVQQLGQVSDQLTSEKKQRLDVRIADLQYLMTVQFCHFCNSRGVKR